VSGSLFGRLPEALVPVIPVAGPPLDMLALRVSARELSRQLAPVLCAGETEVFGQLCTVPDNMLALLDSPEGWGTLAGYVAARFGMAPPAYQPTLH
jgi:hypothetical protein